MKTRLLLCAAVVLFAALPVLAEDTVASQPVEANEVTLETVAVAPDEVAPAESSESACEVSELTLSTGPFEESLAALANHCGGTTDCARPFNPIWNAYCNNWCQNAGYVGGACGRNRCCLCIANP